MVELGEGSGGGKGRNSLYLFCSGCTAALREELVENTLAGLSILLARKHPSSPSPIAFCTPVKSRKVWGLPQGGKRLSRGKHYSVLKDLVYPGGF